jgi:hypothetical protein
VLVLERVDGVLRLLHGRLVRIRSGLAGVGPKVLDREGHGVADLEWRDARHVDELDARGVEQSFRVVRIPVLDVAQLVGQLAVPANVGDGGGLPDAPWLRGRFRHDYYGRCRVRPLGGE